MVTKSSVVAMQPGGVPARAKVKPAAAGLALINETLDADVVRAMVDADRFRIQVQQNNVYLGEGELSERGRFIERARPLHRDWLPSFARAYSVSNILSGIIVCVLLSADASGGELDAALSVWCNGQAPQRRGGSQAARVRRHFQPDE